MTRRVAVSGLGLVCPLGDSAAEVYAAAHDARSAVRRLDDRPYAHRLVAPLGAPARFDPTPHFDPPRLRMLDRVAQMALVATRSALADAGLAATPLSDPARGGVFVGTGMAGTLSNDDGYRTLYGEASDRIKPYTVLLGMHNASAGWISIQQGWTGPSLTYSTACSSSAVAIGEASLRIARGELDLALAGGSEAPLSFGSLKAWEALHTLASIDPDDASRSCKPFARNRSGMVLGEGAVMLVLEPWDRAVARGIVPLGEVLGYGLTTDAGHITRPSVAGQAQAMRAALAAAGLAPERVDAINAHGTGTAANDGVETEAIRAVFGEHAQSLAVSSTKAVHGHLLGAAGALECALSLLAMRHRALLPTAHLDQPDPACDLDHVAGGARDGVAVRTMLSNSFAFGGTNAVLALGAGD